MNAIDPKVYRSTLGLCLGMQADLTTALVVVTTRRDDPKKTLYASFDWESEVLDMEVLASCMRDVRKAFHPVFTCGFLGGRDDEKVARTISMCLGQHIETVPQDAVTPLKLVIDDLRHARLRIRPDSLVARDARVALWREGTPDQTGPTVALRCAHWAALQYRQQRSIAATTTSPEEAARVLDDALITRRKGEAEKAFAFRAKKAAEIARGRKRKMEVPW